ncbi:hypothetical protein M0R45_005096 [Rubus argutus]|uniref:Uncharacterized protein n=1 Tax=Rubus argutus TaxID=59490 RepID=A0AAW1YM77_RUBAR
MVKGRIWQNPRFRLSIPPISYPIKERCSFRHHPSSIPQPTLPRSIGLGTYRSCSLAHRTASQPTSSPSPISSGSDTLPQSWLLSLSAPLRLHPSSALAKSKRPPLTLFEPRSKTTAQPPTPIQIASPLMAITHAQS